MSWLSSLTGIHLGNVGAPVGALLGSVIPGVGTALGAGLGQAIGGIGSGHSVGQSAAQGLGAYAGAKGLQGLFGQGGSGGSGGSGGINLGGILGEIPGLSGLFGGQGGAGGGGGINLGQIANLGLGAGALANAAQMQGRSNQYAQNAYQTAQDAYNSRNGLRSAGVAGMLNPTSGVNLGPLQQTAGIGNPFAPKPGASPGMQLK